MLPAYCFSCKKVLIGNVLTQLHTISRMTEQ